MINFDKSNQQHLDKLYNLTKLYQLFSIYSYKDEKWVNIKDYPKYQISDYGRVKSFNYANTNIPIIRKLSKIAEYLHIQLEKKKSFSIHKLVAVNFEIANPENKNTLDHININTFDNRLINLQYATRKEQNNNRNMNKEKEKLAGTRAINMLNPETLKIENTFISAVEAAEWIRNNTNYKKAKRGNISSVVNGLQNSVYKKK
jgi:hypothetical protein